MQPSCSHRPPCPGCPRFGDERLAPPAVGRLQRLCAELGAPAPEVVAGTGLAYRHRVRLSVRGRATSPKIGIFREGSHDVVDIPRCVVHHPLINDVVAATKRAVRLTRTAPYSEAAHAGVLRSLQVVVERRSRAAQVVLVANASSPASLDDMNAALVELLGSSLHSLWWNGNPERTNRVLGSAWHKYWGADVIEDQFGGAPVFFPPDAFGQANPTLAARIVEQIHDWVPSGSRVLELYAGVGAIGLGLLAKGCTLELNEVGPGSLRGLAQGLQAQGLQAQGLEPSGVGASVTEVRHDGRWAARARIVPGPAEGALGLLGGADVVIVDPPRKGLGPAVCDALREAAPERLVYLSCGLDSFEREARCLAEGLRLARVIAYGLFPYTDHVETLAEFRKRG